MGSKGSRTRRASVLLAAIVAIVIVGGLGYAFLMVVGQRSLMTLYASSSEMALHTAESGIDDAVNEINVNVDYGGDGTGNVSGAIGGGGYAVSIAPPFQPQPQAGGEYTLTSVGRHGTESRGLEVVVAPQNLPPTTFAAFGANGVDMDSNALVDSYNSTLGSYSSQVVNQQGAQPYANANGDVGSNAGVHLDSNAILMGDGIPGPQSSVTLDGTAYVSGSTSPASQPVELPPIQLPPEALLPGQTFTAVGGSSTTFAPGGYHFTSFDVESGASVVFQAPSTIVIDSFESGSNSGVTLDTTAGTIRVYFTGEVDIDSNSSVSNSTQDPARLLFYITTDNISNPNLEVEIDSNNSLCAVVYAPNARLELDSNGHLFGTVIAKEVLIDSNFEIHYDENLVNIVIGTKEYKVKSWREFTP